MHLFDRADVNAEVFIEQLYEARKITTGRANIQKRSEVGKNPARPAGFPNRMPYFFRVLEEKLGLSGKISSETEDEQASGGLSKASAAEAFGVEETVDGDGIARPLAKAGLAEGAAIEDGGSGSGQEGSLATAHRDSPAVPKPVSSLPEEVEVAEAARVSIWRDYLPDPQDSQPRAVLMLWGFVRDAIRDRLNTARRSQLDALLPKWDASRPRTLLLLCQTACTAIVAELHLRREIEPQLGKLLSRFFDEIQVVYAPWREEN